MGLLSDTDLPGRTMSREMTQKWTDKRIALTVVIYTLQAFHVKGVELTERSYMLTRHLGCQGTLR